MPCTYWFNEVFFSVLRIDSHPTLPMIASCNVVGSCIFIDVTNVSSPKIFNCFHLHRDFLDKMKFSRCGELLALGNSHAGKVFIIAKPLKQQRANVVGHLEIGVYVRQLFTTYNYEYDKSCKRSTSKMNSLLSLVGGWFSVVQEERRSLRSLGPRNCKSFCNFGRRQQSNFVHLWNLLQFLRVCHMCDRSVETFPNVVSWTTQVPEHIRCTLSI